MKQLKILIGLSLMLLMSSCNEIFDQDLTKTTVTVISPLDGTKSSSYAQTFWWNALSGSGLKYEIKITQIVTDSSTTPHTSYGLVIVDSITTADKYTYTFAPGVYQWSVQAENSSSVSKYTVQNLTISVGSITSQTPVLSSPADSIAQISSLFSLTWQSVYGAVKYKIEIDTISGSFATPIVNSSVAISNSNNPTVSFSHTFLAGGAYKWRVAAVDKDSSYSQWSNEWVVFYENTPPAKVLLSFPGVGASPVLPVTFEWQTVSSAYYYKFYLVTDTVTMNPYNITTGSISFPVKVSGTSYKISTINDSSMKLWWTVRAVDRAGNVGPYSEKRLITLTN
ncbi:MAG TPA: hypothetical protein VNW06_11655 [Cytophagaceae bacterium]|jgi:hypothetical protein|nr:hypothetical protein [Cytophagaceae bacterium]